MPRSGRVGDVALYRRVLEQARPYRLHFVALFVVGLLASPIALLTPVPLRIVVDSVLGARPLPRLLGAVLPPPPTPSPPGLQLVPAAPLSVVPGPSQLQPPASTPLRTYFGERPAPAFPP